MIIIVANLMLLHDKCTNCIISIGIVFCSCFRQLRDGKFKENIAKKKQRCFSWLRADPNKTNRGLLGEI